MRVFVDTNIWLDLTLHRPGFADSSALLLRCSARSDELWIAWHTVSNLDYIHGRAKLTAARREEHLRAILLQARIAPTDETDALHALSLGWADFEDALQFAAAVRCQADVLLTGNIPGILPEPPSRCLQCGSSWLRIHEHHGCGHPRHGHKEPIRKSHFPGLNSGQNFRSPNST